MRQRSAVRVPHSRRDHARARSASSASSCSAASGVIVLTSDAAQPLDHGVRRCGEQCELIDRRPARARRLSRPALAVPEASVGTRRSRLPFEQPQHLARARDHRRRASPPAARPRCRTSGPRRPAAAGAGTAPGRPPRARRRYSSALRPIRPRAAPARGSASRRSSCSRRVSCRCSLTAHAIDTPSYVLVPRPISSSSTRLRARRRVQDGARLRHLHHERRLPAHEVVARAHAREHAVAHADRRRRRGHEAPRPAPSARSARPGAGSSLLPAMFGPVRMMSRASSVSRTSFGMNLSRGIIRSTTGCRPPTIVEVEVVRRSPAARSPRAPRRRRAPPARPARRRCAPRTAGARSRARPRARSASNSSRSRASIRSAAVSTRSSYSLSAGVT